MLEETKEWLMNYLKEPRAAQSIHQSFPMELILKEDPKIGGFEWYKRDDVKRGMIHGYIGELARDGLIKDASNLVYFWSAPRWVRSEWKPAKEQLALLSAQTRLRILKYDARVEKLDERIREIEDKMDNITKTIQVAKIDLEATARAIELINFLRIKLTELCFKYPGLSEDLGIAIDGVPELLKRGMKAVR